MADRMTWREGDASVVVSEALFEVAPWWTAVAVAWPVISRSDRPTVVVTGAEAETMPRGIVVKATSAPWLGGSPTLHVMTDAEALMDTAEWAYEEPLPMTLAVHGREDGEFTAKPFLDRAPSWLLDHDRYARQVFDEACLRSAAAFSGGHGRLPDATHNLREWWETLTDYLFVAADSTLDEAETDAEREDAEAVRRLAQHFLAGFADEFPTAPPSGREAK